MKTILICCVEFYFQIVPSYPLITGCETFQTSCMAGS